MKKIVFLLITSILVISCGITGEEPKGPNQSDNSGITNNNTKPLELGKIYFKNLSGIISYKCYIGSVDKGVQAPRSQSDYTKCTDGTYRIKVEQYDNIYNDYIATYIDNVTIKKGQVTCIDFPLRSSLTLQSSSSSDYYIEINDGLLNYICNSGDAIELSNIDCTTFKVKFTQKNGYLFFPTKKTVYINVPKEGKIYKFNP